VKFFIYALSTQMTCLRLMGRKMLVALMMEGKFSGEGIHSMDAEDDMMAAMARELVEKGRIGESADAVWGELRRERTLQADTSAAFGAHSGPEQSEPLALADLSLSIAQPVPTLTLVHSKAKKPHSESVWPSGYVVGDQMKLFG
jgi:hypothetical protein